VGACTGHSAPISCQRLFWYPTGGHLWNCLGSGVCTPTVRPMERLCQTGIIEALFPSWGITLRHFIRLLDKTYGASTSHPQSGPLLPEPSSLNSTFPDHSTSKCTFLDSVFRGNQAKTEAQALGAQFLGAR
jgi:hypothetical protein